MQSARRFFKAHWPIILLIIINMVIGLVVVRDYGQSWDEPGIQKYGGQALSAYGRLIRGEDPPAYESDHMFYGPAFGMLGAMLVRGLDASGLGWLSAEYWHLVYFLSFQVAVTSIYLLSQRWMGRWAAFGVALIFTTQPLIWGHAFINPKDIPFMAFFLLSIALGLAMVDKAAVAHLPEDGSRSSGISWKDLLEEWKKAGAVKRRVAGIPLAFWVGAGIFLAIFQQTVKTLVIWFVTSAYNSGGEGFWGSLFSRIAPNATNIPVESYIRKAQSLFVRVEVMLFVLSGIVLVFILLRYVAPITYRRFMDERVQPGFRESLFFLKQPFLYWAAIIFGLTISIRVLGPYAGILVGLFAVWKLKWQRSLTILIPYFALAMLVAYLTWPFLWRDPVGRFLESVQVMSRFVQQDVGNLQGNLSAFSWLSIPKLASIQLTESLLIVFLAGLIVALFNLKNRKYLEPFLLWVLWFLAPVIWMIVSNNTLYDNFRQLFFVLPPLFIIGGLALDGLFAFLGRNWLNGMVIALLALPGIYACIHLHPYEYIYYNSFVGGVKGAFRHYELDYWATSYKEAAEYLNEKAPLDAEIGVVGTDLIFKPYARPDLKVFYFNGVDVGKGFDYVVVSSRANNDLAVCPNAKVIKTIERDGAVLASIKQISSPEDCVLSP